MMYLSLVPVPVPPVSCLSSPLLDGWINHLGNDPLPAVFFLGLLVNFRRLASRAVHRRWLSAGPELRSQALLFRLASNLVPTATADHGAGLVSHHEVDDL